MPGQATFVMDAVVVGVGATAVMDLWAVVQRRLFGIPSLDFAMVGRWLGHLPRGRFRHDGIGRAAAVSGERALGWTAHYVIGVVFAALLLAVAGSDWVQAPTLWPALAFGILSVAAPFFILQPGMGAGIAASKTPAPRKARLRSLVAHSVFGVGMYLSALLLAAVRAG
ncbi:TPA: DUF2938 domain-containing protein [Stenotrophomonas maltophilia]|uniref:DUF2938 domain-containing protein n=1 Tax=Stenotrophomonas maltophilia TaxID=40324 RepID=A0AAI9CQN2_STEMA|nr:hypothetical protein A1OC_02072 [Stenotrophomonas maltophilia Ab55555]EKZ1925553.1 DUF2938 domain-containing protein [Stenotrophomonas maltophilia]EKZ1929627.1 DUF2938 domain-containing protein [Stenotrophomonas maltophilia]ELE7121059.1 DUF2938 domain-containing protein [Stenotrophomonas maltophilia]ELE7125248.1 DUF2938 domain-containing protein [Stenotrophomonas maltophilia]